MSELLIVGAGGVGSYLVSRLDDLINKSQLLNINITVADGDIVELKNTKYQNYKPEEVTMNKASALSERYFFLGIDKFISVNDKTLKQYDCIVLCVDSSKFRKEYFAYSEKKPQYWIDLRSEGKSVAYYTKNPNNTKAVMLNTLPKEDVESGSCQYPYELEQNTIQLGNVIIADIGAQLILNWYRGSYNSPEFIYTFGG
jgi:molybdopterin/thiamine biosynthesis adenylyltransferase